LGKRIDDKGSPLIFEEIFDDLSLNFERSSMKPTKNNEGEELDTKALISSQLKRIFGYCGQIAHKKFQCKNLSNHNDENNGKTTGGNYCVYSHKSGYVRHNCICLYQGSNNNNGNRNQESMTHKI
jgi:hypothetical protein